MANSDNVFLDFIQQVQRRSEDVASINEANRTSMIEIADENASIGTQLNEQKAASAIQQNNAAFQAQQNAQALAAQFGGKLGEPTEIISQLGSEFRNSTAEAIELRKQYGKLDAVTFFDNPIAWIGNQIKKDQIAAQHNAASDIASVASNKMRELNAIVTGGAQAQKAISDVITADSLAADNEAAALQAKFNANQLKLESAKVRVDAYTAMLNDDKQTLSLLGEEQRYLDQKEYRALMLEQRKLAMEQRDALHQERLAKTKDANLAMQAQIDAATEMAEFIELGAAKHGVKITVPRTNDDGKVDPKAYDRWAKLNNKERLQYFASLGMQAKAGMPIVFGQDILESITVVASVANPENLPHRDTFATLNTKRAAITQSQKYKKAQKSEDKEAILREGLIDEMLSWQANAEAPGSLYSSPGIMPIIESTGKFANINFQETVLVPLAVAGSKDDYKTLLTSAREAVKRGELNQQEAISGITEYYNKVKTYNNIARGFVEYGIKPQEGYIVSASIPALDNPEAGIAKKSVSVLTLEPVSDTLQFDLTKEEEVRKYFLLTDNRNPLSKLISGGE